MSERGPSSETGIDTEAEVQGISLAKEIAELRRAAKTNEDYEAILHKTSELKGLFGLTPIESEAKLPGEIMEQMKEAKELFKDDFLGPEEVEKAFLSRVEVTSIPPIPFSRSELERAQELGQMLILRVGEASGGVPLTMLNMHDMLSDSFSSESKGKILLSRDDEWKLKSDFYTKEVPSAGWGLVAKEVVPDSMSSNYLEQTDTITKYLINGVFKDEKLPEAYQKAVDEFTGKRAEIAKLMGEDWQKAAERLEGLEITKLTRQSPAEVLYDLIVYFQSSGGRLLESMYTWTKRRDSDGGLVDVGSFDAKGVSVGSYRPDNSNPRLGVSLSRSLGALKPEV